MLRARRWLVLTALAALIAGVLAATPGSSRAQGAAAGVPVSQVAMSAPVAANGTDDVLAYWTDKRMQSALPLILDPLGRLLTGKKPAKASSKKAAGSGTLTSPRSVGKLFFSDGIGNFVCSAAAVNTKTKNVIITAGHCVSERVCRLLSPCKGQYFTNFLFVPRYANGSAPDGRWVGTRAITHQEWFDRENEAFDQALIKVANRNGKTLVGTVGGSGLSWNFPARQNDIRVWGWPAEAPYDGETVKRCSGRTFNWEGTADAGIDCPMTGGSSGGPWFNSTLNSRIGFIWAVTSRRTTSGTPRLIARPLTGAIRNLVAVANGGSATFNPSAGNGPAISTSYAGPSVSRAGISIRAVPNHVGRGQRLEIRVQTGRNRRVTLQTKYSPKGRWYTLKRQTTNASGKEVFVLRPTSAAARRFRVLTSTRASGAVAVRVHACPLPLDRSASVVRSSGCSTPR